MPDNTTPPAPLRDPWHFRRWAYEQRVGNSARKLILGALATMADSTTGYCFAPQRTLAYWAECSERSVIRHVQALVGAGLIACRREVLADGKRGANGYLLLAPGVVAWPGGERVEGLGDNLASGQGCVTPTALSGVTANGSVKGEATATTPGAAKTREQREDDFLNGRPLRLTYRGKAVPEELARRALSALSSYEDYSGQRVQAWTPGGAPTPELKRVLGAVVDHPEVNEHAWRGVAQAVLASPWWAGPPSVGVVFGPNVVASNLANPGRGGARRETAGQRAAREKEERIQQRLERASA